MARMAILSRVTTCRTWNDVDCGYGDAARGQEGSRRQLAVELDSRAMADRPKLAVFDTRPYDRAFLDAANAAQAANAGADGPVFEPRYLEVALTAATAPLAAGCGAVCGFVHDRFDAEALGLLAADGTKLVALRCAGF